MKQAIAYRRRSKVYIHASSQTVENVWILDNPVLCIESDSDIRGIGNAVQDALNGSRQGVSHPVSWSGIFMPVLKLAGIKSWKTFSKSSQCVQIERENDTIIFIPTENGGSKEGYRPLLNQKITSSVHGEIGLDLLETFKRCRVRESRHPTTP